MCFLSCLKVLQETLCFKPTYCPPLSDSVLRQDSTCQESRLFPSCVVPMLFGGSADLLLWWLHQPLQHSFAQSLRQMVPTEAGCLASCPGVSTEMLRDNHFTWACFPQRRVAVPFPTDTHSSLKQIHTDIRMVPRIHKFYIDCLYHHISSLSRQPH